MLPAKQISKPVSGIKNKPIILILVIPLASCVLSSVVGLVLGQMGNIIYKVVGEAANCLAVPGFIILFLVPFGLTLLVNKLLKKWLLGSRKQANNHA